MKNILQYNSIQAKKFFLKEESYCSFDLPFYFHFQKLLNKVSRNLEKRKLKDFQTDISRKFENVNYKLINNKDGKYAWRPIQLIHPAIYCSLVNEITQKDNWKFIRERFENFFQNKSIICLSIPIESESDLSDKAKMITNWWIEIEQKSIQLSMEYDYLVHTDIRDCYGSIYTHSIAWALHDKVIAKARRNDDTLIGNKIDWHLQDMAHGQTNGIPQGSALMDFIAEMVLGYADLLLSERLKTYNDYKILRYRDDYRIFVNNPQTAESILKNLTEILIDLGMKLNDQKTIVSNDVIQDSIKPDKLTYILNKQSSKSLQENLLIIHSLATHFPNSGSVEKALKRFYDRISKIKIRKTKENDILVLISIVTDIAYKNPRSYPICATILSKLISYLKLSEQKGILKTILEKFDKIPNTEHLKIWLQRISIKVDRSIKYHGNLCNKVIDHRVELWNSDWLNHTMKNLIAKQDIIDRSRIKKMKSVISPKEVILFEAKYKHES